jgi:hypothetical protein
MGVSPPVKVYDGETGASIGRRQRGARCRLVRRPASAQVMTAVARGAVLAGMAARLRANRVAAVGSDQAGPEILLNQCRLHKTKKTQSLG